MELWKGSPEIWLSATSILCFPLDQNLRLPWAFSTGTCLAVKTLGVEAMGVLFLMLKYFTSCMVCLLCVPWSKQKCQSTSCWTTYALKHWPLSSLEARSSELYSAAYDFLQKAQLTLQWCSPGLSHNFWEGPARCSLCRESECFLQHLQSSICCELNRGLGNKLSLSLGSWQCFSASARLRPWRIKSPLVKIFVFIAIFRPL